MNKQMKHCAFTVNLGSRANERKVQWVSVSPFYMPQLCGFLIALLSTAELKISQLTLLLYLTN